MRSLHLILIVLVSMTAPALSRAACSAASEDPAEIAQRLQGSLVRVEYTLRYDKGQAPAGGVTERCPSCGAYHSQTGDDAVTQERPLEAAGYLIASDRVLTGDLFMHPRFIDKTQVVLGGESVGARPVAYARTEHAMILQLDRPLKAGKPLQFISAGDEKGLSVVNYSLLNGAWTTTINGLSLGSVNVTEDGVAFRPMSEPGLIVTEQGAPVAMSLSGELPAGDAWQQSPEKWEWIDAAQYDMLLAQAQRAADGGVLRARLDLRSPRADESESPWDYYGYGDSESSDATEIETLCVLLDANTAVILSSLKADVTARLEHITIFPVGSDDGVSATFRASLRDYGALVATLDEPMPAAPEWADADIRSYRNQLLIGAKVFLQGADRIAYYSHERIERFDVGWRRQLYPVVPGDDEGRFIFDASGRLVALPIIKRDRPGAEERWSDPSPILTAASQLSEALKDIDANADPNNTPLSEEEENRIAWLGVIMQSLDSELARQLGVSEVSHDGAVGGLVTFVYPDSPAALAGIETSDVLLRISADSLPAPLDVEVSEEDEFGSAFPWQQLDEVPEEYFEMIPTPWPKVNNAFNKKLTAVGFGTPIRLEYARDGQVNTAEMSVTQSPLYYAAAPQYKSDPLGLTVRTMTFDVRKYFQKADDEPGVIVARVEPGGKASVGGVKPYEIITAVNDVPVHSREEFREAIAGQSELRLSMLRMTRSRLVKITLDEPIVDDDAEAMEGETMEDAADEMGG